MKTSVTDKTEDDDKAKLAYALKRRLPAKDGWEMIQAMFGASEGQARALITKGRRLDAQTTGRKA